MSVKSAILNEGTARYVTEQITTDSSVEARLRAKTEKMPNGGMISPSDVGRLLQTLALSIGARHALEIGTFTGYTALMVAKALPAEGRLIACDVSQEFTDIGRPFWKEAGVSEKIDVRLAPALDTAKMMAGDSMDFAFIDADKTGYDAYYEECLRIVRPGGLIVLDNMLRGGRVADPANRDEGVVAIRALNAKISKDERVTSVLLTIGDGVMLCRRKL